MATTTNYGWTTPDDTSLVKDGASAIRTLGSSIDTSLNNALGTKKAGLVLLNTTSFSAVSTQIIPSVFSATYKSYKIVFECDLTNSTDILLRLRTGSTSAATNYAWQYLRGSGSTAATGGASGQTSWASTTNSASGPAWNEITLHRPFEATQTFLISTWFSNVYSTGITAGLHTTATSYESFEIFPGAGTMTGSVKTYGLNQ